MTAGLWEPEEALDPDPPRARAAALPHVPLPTPPPPAPDPDSSSGGEPAFGAPGYGCIWNQCRQPGRPYQHGEFCATHSPAARAGRPELPEGPGWPRDRDPPDPPPPTDTTPRKEPET